MAEQLSSDDLCPVCLGYPVDPVTVSCGHIYCRSCIRSQWDREHELTKTTRPLLVQSPMFADLVESIEKTKLQDPPELTTYAKPGDVPCDFCIERKLKALKSCLVCQVSYCDIHLEPHFRSPAFHKHKLVEPCENQRDRFCPRHDEVMKVFCRDDQRTLCVLCSMDDHKDHDTVSVAAERHQKVRELGTSRRKIQERIENREEDLRVLGLELEAINRSADRAIEDLEKTVEEIVGVIQRRSSDAKERIRSQQKLEVSRVRNLEESLKKEVVELKGNDAKMEKLSLTEDHVQFLLEYPSLSHLGESTNSPNFNLNPLRYFEDVTDALSEVRDKLKEVLDKQWLKISSKVMEVDVLLPQPEPTTREDFLRYSRRITLDPNSVNGWLRLSEGNRKAEVMREKQPYLSHPERFTDWLQVLGKESLIGRCYWEVERSSGVAIGVAYKDISRTGNESGLGNNDRSWALGCFDVTYYLRHDNVKTMLSGPRESKRLGVFLDHRAGTLSFYRVSEPMALLHRVQTTFTQPLYAGLWVYWVGDTAELCEIT